MDNLYERIGNLVGLSFFSSLFIGLTLFLYAVFNDYIYYNLNLAVNTLESNNLIGSWVADLMQNFQDTILVLIPNMLDLLWALIFIIFAFNFLQSAYFTKREGYFSALGLLTFGIMIILFIMSIFITLSTWFQTEFIAKVMPTLIYATPLFSLYINNIGFINTGLIVLAIIINFVDLNINNFRFRKDKENLGNELQ